MKDRRFPTQLVSFLLALTIIFAGSTLYYGIRTEKYQTTLTHSHEKAYSELLESLSDLDAALQKIRYTASPSTISTLSAQIWRQAECAKSALSLLPSSEEGLEKTQTFIARTGDYAYSLLRAASRGQTATQEQKEALTSLCTTAQSLTEELTLLKARLDAGEMYYEPQAGSDTSALADSFSTMEQEFPQYATLIYDGPFSQHLEKQNPAMLEGQKTVSEAQARAAAAAFCSLPEDSFSLDYKGSGTIACYSFSTQQGVSVDVSQAGGFVYRMSDASSVGEASLTAQEGVERAAVFLEEHGYGSMKESYYTRFDNMLTINFCHVQDGVMIYPDLVKVSVALDDGAIIGFESRGYMMSHRERSIDTPQVSEADARAKVESSLKILETRLAVIPTDWKSELLCYEFICTTQDDMHVIVYINALSGIEENILILIESEDGTLTM